MTSKHWDRKDLLGLEGLNASEIEAILDAALSFKSPHGGKSSPRPLAGRAAALLFSEPSTRTRSSFEVAARGLGADVLNFSQASSSLRKGETFLDTVRTLEALGVEYFIVRHERPGLPEALAAQTRVSILNAGDGAHEHPTQALLDLFTLRQRRQSLKGLRVVIVGDILHSRVARSNIYGLKKLGARVTLCGPSALIPKDIQRLGVSVSHELDQALGGADAVVVLRLQLERQKQNLIPSLSGYYASYGLTPERLAKAPDCLVLHPGPLNRGVEIASEVADGPQSVILDQVTNGLAVRQAVLSLIADWRTRHV